MGNINPGPTLSFAEKLILHKDPQIRREIVHGIESRGRTHPEDILPLLKKLEYDNSKLIRDTLVHVLGQISYKKRLSGEGYY
jgi:HEAT repeat protein